MSIYWGVQPVLRKGIGDVSFIVQGALEEAKKREVVRPGDIVVLTVGDPSTSITLYDKQTCTNVVYVAQVR